MLEMKMAASAKVYLVSGFPRSMRDMAEYSDKGAHRGGDGGEASHTDSAAVLEDFCSVISSLMTKAEAGENAGPPNGALGGGMEILPPTAGAYHQNMIHDLNTGVEPTRAVQMNGNVRAATVSDVYSNGGLTGSRRSSRDSIRKMYAELEGYSAE